MTVRGPQDRPRQLGWKLRWEAVAPQSPKAVRAARRCRANHGCEAGRSLIPGPEAKATQRMNTGKGRRRMSGV
jgi:hypothetical protein